MKIIYFFLLVMACYAALRGRKPNPLACLISMAISAIQKMQDRLSMIKLPTPIGLPARVMLNIWF